MRKDVEKQVNKQGFSNAENLSENKDSFSLPAPFLSFTPIQREESTAAKSISISDKKNKYI